MKRYTLTANQAMGRVTLLTMRPAVPSARMEFRPGQYIAIGFRRFGRKSPMRCFSLVNTANAAGELQIAFRRQGNFTDVLSGLRPGAELFVGGPYGSFQVPAGQQYPLVYLAAGIGITPFLSLLQGQIRRGQTVPTTLLYSCRTLDDIPFAADLTQWAQQHSWLTVRFLVDQVPDGAAPNPQIIPGKLTSAVLTDYGDPEADYYLCGPSGYNQMAHDMLGGTGVTVDQLHTESFGQGKRLRLAGMSVSNMVYSLTALVLLGGVGGTFLLDSLGHKRVSASSAQSAGQESAGDTSGSDSPDSGGSSGAYDPYANGSSQNEYPQYSQPMRSYQPPMSSVS